MVDTKGGSQMAEDTNQNEKQGKQTLREAPIDLDRSQMPANPHNTRDIETHPSPARIRFLTAAFLVIVSISAGFAGGWLGGKGGDGKASIQQQQVVLKNQGELISTLAKQVGPSVVSVEVVSESRNPDAFFGFQGPTEQTSAGTGIIIDKSGLIITNRHVIPAGSKKIGVTLSDGTKFDEVEIIGRTSASDPLDIAFLKIKDLKGTSLTAAKIGDSSQVKVGESVIAIGNALGQFQNTVTSGIISGYGRSIVAGDETGTGTETLQNLFQTDAAINQGNSGGPLINLEGEVVGINTAIAGGSAQNIGFAIPINDVKGLIASVVEKGKLERPYLGVVFVTITADVAKQYDLKSEHGAYIPPSVATGRQVILPGSPAEKAGLKEGDIITKVGNDKVDETHSLTSLLGKRKVGETVKLTIVRDGSERTIDATLSAAPEE
jgi:serine protease Do